MRDEIVDVPFPYSGAARNKGYGWRDFSPQRHGLCRLFGGTRFAPAAVARDPTRTWRLPPAAWPPGATPREESLASLSFQRRKLKRITMNEDHPLILLVDDDRDGREMYAEYLMFRGFRVATASSGAQAVALASGPERPAVILMDLEMRGMSGADALRALRANPALICVPILALTAHAMSAERETAIRDGFDDVIPKPCLPDELVAIIDRYLAQT
jgi:two-component system, cell cycle response regulator DivK